MKQWLAPSWQISDPKIKASAVELMTALLMREKKEKGGADGPVAKAMNVLAESKDSGHRMLHKKAHALLFFIF